MVKLITFIFSVQCSVLSLSQSSLAEPNSHDQFPTYFGIQLKPIFPFGLIEPTDYSLGKDGLETRISQKYAFAVGGMIRKQITSLFGIETGINYIQRQYNLGASIPDSSISIAGDMTFVQYEIPINGLISIKLSDAFFMTSSMGASIYYKPSDSHDLTHSNERHYFLFYADRKNKFALGVNANLGFEYRTKKSGTFYLGGSASIPIQPLFEFELLHQYDANLTSIFSDIDGAFISMEIKYFFPLIKNKGVQFVQGPIE